MPSLDWNAVRFDPAARRDHVESWFAKMNDPEGERALWLKATIFARADDPGSARAEGWAIAFDRRGGTRRHAAAKHTVPYGDATFDASGLGIRWSSPRTGESLEAIGETRDGRAVCRLRGAIGAGDGRLEWALELAGEARPIVPLPLESMYEGPFPKSKLVTPLPDAIAHGEVNVRGERWSLDGWRGMQGHNWGRGHADSYAWCHVGQWDEGGDLVLEGFSGRVRVGPVMSPLTTIVCVRHRGVVYDFNRPADILRARGDVTARSWTFSASNDLAHVEGTVEAEAADMVGLFYPNPSGPTTYCLNSKLARARVRFEPRGRPPVVLSTRAAALEIGTHRPDHGVRMYA